MMPCQDLIVQKLRDSLPRFREFLRSEQSQRWETERREKDAFFDRHFRTEAALKGSWQFDGFLCCDSYRGSAPQST